MIEPFVNKERNGYACLWSLIRRTCQYMKPEPDGLGPDWPINETLEKYVVKLQAYCCVTKRKNTKTFTKFQQSKEMLYQAAFLYNQPIATKLDNDLSIWKSANWNTVLSDEWQIEGLLDKFADYNGNIGPRASKTSGSNMTINALLKKPERERNLYNNNKKKFEMRPIQCDYGKCGGHKVGKQVCRIGAQFHHIL